MAVTKRRRLILIPPPDSIAHTQLTDFGNFCAARTGQSFPDHAALHRFSVEEFRRFWRLFLEWSGLICDGDPEPVCVGDACEHAAFFPHLELNYVENLLANRGTGDDARPALTACHFEGAPNRLSRGELHDRVMRAADAFRRLGVGSGDRVVAIVHNNAEAVICCLAAATLGAIFSAAAPEMVRRQSSAGSPNCPPRSSSATCGPRRLGTRQIGSPRLSGHCPRWLRS
jgi:acetoacetyl-CoA synthetase